MRDRTNLKVYCFLRIIECILSSICFSFHIFKIMAIEDESYPHEMIFRIAYLAFVIFSAISALGHIKDFLNYYLEATSGVFGFIFYIFASIWSMSVVEHDKHLEYLSESEEYQHLFFQLNRFQSVTALLTAMLFLLHATFSIDIISGLKENKIENISSSTQLPRYSTESIDSDDQRKPLRLFFFPETLWEKVFNKKHS